MLISWELNIQSVRRFRVDRTVDDFKQICRWLALRGLPQYPRSIFPKIGFIVDDIAVGFLYLTDSSVGIIDCYISNPESNKHERDVALDRITEELLETASISHCTIVKCDSKIEAINKRALKFGFRPSGSHESFSLEV